MHIYIHAQFLRALNVALNNSMLISREEEDALCAKYARSDGLINYRNFADNCTFIQRDLEKAPLVSVWDSPLADSHPRNSLSPKVCCVYACRCVGVCVCVHV